MSTCLPILALETVALHDRICVHGAQSTEFEGFGRIGPTHRRKANRARSIYGVDTVAVRRSALCSRKIPEQRSLEVRKRQASPFVERQVGAYQIAAPPAQLAAGTGTSGRPADTQHRNLLPAIARCSARELLGPPKGGAKMVEEISGAKAPFAFTPSDLRDWWPAIVAQQHHDPQRSTPDMPAASCRMVAFAAPVRRSSREPEMSDAEFLTAPELHALTGYARAAEQEAWLLERGLAHRRDGKRMIVSRFHTRSWLEGKAPVVSRAPNLAALHA